VAARTARYSAVHILLVSAPIFPIGLAIPLWFARHRIEHSPSFEFALMLAPSTVYAAAFAALGLWVAWALTRSLRATQTATLALSIAYAIWAVLLGLSTTRGGVGTGLVAYVALSTMASAASASCRKAPLT
jgi:hypothetical protein